LKVGGCDELDDVGYGLGLREIVEYFV